jgi:hypothetical protein
VTKEMDECIKDKRDYFEHIFVLPLQFSDIFSRERESRT